MLDRIKIIKVQYGGWHLSYDAFVDEVFVNNYKTKKDAKLAAEARIVNLAEEERQLNESIQDEFGNLF